MRPPKRFTRLRTLCILLPFAAAAQQTVAPTPEAVGPPRGQPWENYNVTTSFETGYRFSTVAGNDAQYRSSVNFGNGVRLLGASFTMHSTDGHGRFFDEALFNAQGLGGDPYESAVFRIQKNRLYRYDLFWRHNDYFNPGLTSGGAEGLHLLDTAFRSQNHDLALFPQSRVRFFLGYTHDAQEGAGISTVPAFTPETAFPVFSNIRWSRDEYRAGNEIRYRGLTFNWLHGWENFKDDTDYRDGTFDTFRRTEPYHGTSPYWRVFLAYERPWFNANGRFTYTSGRRAYVLNETAAGTGGPGVPGVRQILSYGTARRPVTTGNLSLAFLPSPRLTFTNQTAVYNVRTEGDNAFLDLVNATQSGDFLFFSYLGIFTAANRTDVSYQAAPWLGFHGGYHFSQRRIRSVQQFTTVSSTGRTAPEQTNRLNAGTFGIRLSAARSLTVMLDGELGRASLPFTPRSEDRYHAVTGRIRYRLKTLQLMAWSGVDYNTNSVTLSAYSSHARSYSGSASWAPRAWLGLDATYSKLHLDTVGGIAYFSGPQLIEGDRSRYVSDIHSGTLGLRSVMGKRATLYAGYSIVRDTAQSFPLIFQSPLGRVSVRLAGKLRLNAGYQYYGYREDNFGLRGFRANTGYTSLLWSF